MEHENRGEVNAKDNQSTQEERGIIDIHNEITKAINDFISEDFYNSQSEGRDVQ